MQSPLWKAPTLSAHSEGSHFIPIAAFTASVVVFPSGP